MTIYTFLIQIKSSFLYTVSFLSNENINYLIFLNLTLNFVFQRSKYEIWRGFGSDGYLYDFVRKRNRYEPEIEVPKVSYLSSKPVIHRFQRSRYDIWRGFGSDGYLYDFVK